MDFLNEEFDQILNIFREESEEILDRINNNLLKLEKDPSDKEAVFQLFRDAHGLKGASRMVGFVNIQNIAHKIEDILGLCKENKLEMNAAICDTLLKSVDFLWLLVKNSIQLKADYSTNELGYYQSNLQNIIDSASSTPINISVKKVFNTNFYNDIPNINATIIEALYVMDKTIDSEEKIEFLKDLFEKLYEMFANTDYFDIKQALQDITSKLNFVLNATGILTTDEIMELKNKTKDIIDTYKKILESYDYKEEIDFYNYSQHNETKEDVEAQPETPEQKISQKLLEAFAILKSEFAKLDGLKANISLITTNLNVISMESEDASVKKVCSLLCEFFNMFAQNKVSLDSEIINILKQTLKSLEGIICNNTGFQYDDINLLEQRLTILFQILDLESVNMPTTQIESGEKSNFIKLDNTAENQQKKAGNDYFSNMEAVAIKTLRVDAQKLDNLANSISELIINKIKAPAQLNDLGTISSNVNELKNFIMKSINYVKYYEAKFNEAKTIADMQSNINNIQAFQKHLLYLFQEINKKNVSIYDKISLLYEIIQEDSSKNAQILENVERTIKDIRILPLATIFHMFPRMVRDLSYENGKQIDLEIIGNETSVDKKIVEEIKIPLIHIIRNSIDHGIETPEERVKANKNPTGRIKINAFHEYNKIVIEVTDDGHGVDVDKIRTKAIEKKLLSEEELAAMSNEQIMNLVFYPGFSTEDVVTELSGRGVGLDIVQTKITQLNGKVKISSILGQGSVVRLELPITTATINTFIFKIGSNYFAIPVDIINSLYMISPQEIVQKGNKDFVIIDNENIPVFWISDILGLAEEKKNVKRWTVMIINNDGAKIGYIIKNLEDDEEVILRKFSPPLFKVTNFAGLTTLVNGSTCLILNMRDIIQNTIAKKQLFIPLQQPEEHPTEKKSAKILILDDSNTTRNLLKNILDTQEYDTEIAPLPSIALELTTQIKFDLIITDMEMPEMDGLEFIKKVKMQTYNAQTPVIIFSSYNDDEYIKMAKQMGVSHYLYKNDFNQKVFTEIVNESLKGNNG